MIINKLNKQLEETILALEDTLDLAHELSEVSKEEFNSFSRIKQIKSILRDSKELNYNVEKARE